MFHLKRTIYLIFAFIVIHLFMYMFEIDIFEFFDKRVSNRTSSDGVSDYSNTAPNVTSDRDLNIDTNIQELEKSLEELKDITKV